MTDIKISGADYTLTPLNADKADDTLRRILLNVENPKTVDLRRWKCTDQLVAQPGIMITIDPIVLFAAMAKGGKKIGKKPTAEMRGWILGKAGLKRPVFDAAAKKAVGPVKLPLNIDKFVSCGMLLMFEFTVRLSIQFRFFKLTFKGDTSGNYAVVGIPFAAELSAVNVVPCEKDKDIKTTFSRVMQVRFAAPKAHGDMVEEWRKHARESQERDNAQLKKDAKKKGVDVKELPTPPK